MGRYLSKRWSRRKFIGGLALAGSAALMGLRPEPAAAEPPPETTRLRLMHGPSMCHAPQYVAKALLQSEGFQDVQYTRTEEIKGIELALASGKADINMHFAGPLLLRLEAGDPITVLAGGHVGCFELFANGPIRRISDLKHKTVAVTELGSSQHVFLASILSYVGVDPVKNVHWTVHPRVIAKRLLAEGRVDAYLGFPPDPQELRAEQVGHVILNSAVDRPWSQYFCCMVAGNREFVRTHPIATKRALRAILKAADACALEPAQSARFLVQQWYPGNYDYVAQVLRDLPYGKWREFDPEDTIRFYALRLREAGMIKSSPQKLIAEGTDWRFLIELKKELKA